VVPNSQTPDVELICVNKTPILRGHGATGFAIINITYEDHILRAIDRGKLQLLNASDSCDFAPIWNTSAKLGGGGGLFGSAPST
jgi:hypothetical protein